MASLHKIRSSATPLLCTRTHQIFALILIATTFFLTRTFDQSLSSCNYFSNGVKRSQDHFFIDNGGTISWPSYGYRNSLDLKIYVYNENEIDGLKELMYGRDGKISTDSCVKGQWGTRVKIHRMLLESRFRTLRKEEADLFFVPTYVKCVRMMGGLSDEEINATYVKVLSQMPYFRLSGGRDHIFVFPRKEQKGGVEYIPHIIYSPVSLSSHAAKAEGRRQGRVQIVPMLRKPIYGCQEIPGILKHTS